MGVELCGFYVKGCVSCESLLHCGKIEAKMSNIFNFGHVFLVSNLFLSSQVSGRVVELLDLDFQVGFGR